MMEIENFMSPDSIFIGIEAHGKKQALEEIINRMADKVAPGLDTRATLRLLLEREKLGCTGIGGGIAIPHAKCDLPEGRTAPVAVLATLASPIDFQANDNAAVDIVFMLLAAEDGGSEHLTLLALASRLLTGDDLAAKLRAAITAIEAWEAIRAAEMGAAA